MRRRMRELAAGVFEQEGPRIKLSSNRLELFAYEQEKLKGSFVIESANRVPMKGIVYSDNPRMQIMEPEFGGTSAVVEYEFHTDGLCEGDIQKGDFFVICNKNEYTLSFVVSTTRPITTIEDIRLDSLAHFTQLAQKNYEKAYEFFCSSDFPHCLKHDGEDVKLMARILAYEGAPISNMEEFLTSTMQKEPVGITCEFPKGCYENLTEDMRDVIVVNKQGWGNVQVELAVDAPFLVLQQNVYTREDFIGNSCRIPFYITVHNLHNGKNFGRITLRCGFQEYHFDVLVVCSRGGLLADEYHMDKRITLLELTRMYVDYRIGSTMPATFASQTLQKIDHYLGIEPKNLLALLYKAQVLLLGGRTQEAQWVLDQVKKERLDKESQEYHYYLFITTFLNHERSYIKKVAAKIQQTYQRYPDNGLYFWILLFIGEAYENSKQRKYHAINNFCMTYSNSPIFYVEAYSLIKEHPEFIEPLGEFEVRVLRWAQKEGLITKGIIDNMTIAIRHCSGRQRQIMPILSYGYKQWPNDELLASICAYLIHGSCYGKEDFVWYEEAVKKELKIHGLYEAYIMSASGQDRQEYPKMVQYYFQYKTNLHYKYKAKVYAGIIQNREQQTTLYLNCKPEIEQFAIEQITAGHMDENLAVIYDLYLRTISITHELSRSLSPILYVHKLYCECPDILHVVVAHRQIKKIQSYPVINHVAYFPIYSADYVIAFEDGKRRRYVKSVEYDLIRLMNVSGLTKKCLKVAPEQMPYLIQYFHEIIKKPQSTWDFTEMDLGYLNILLASDAITEEYKQLLRPGLIEFYHQSGRTELLDEYLRSLELKGFAQDTRVQACELMVERGFYQKAYENIIAYGCHQMQASKMLILCTKLIEASEYEADDYLTGICTLLFKRGKYNEMLLTYLLKYMYGSTKSLYELWIASRDFELNAYELEERLLVQMLYSEKFVPQSEEILSHYIQSGGKKLVLDAYVSYFAYHYFVKGSPANELVMEQIYGMVRNEQKLNQLLKFTLLRWLSDSQSEDYVLMRALYEELVLQGYVFEFYDELPAEVTVNFPRSGKRVIEYRTNPQKAVYIKYLHTDFTKETESNDYILEKMEHMYEGIFAKDVTLFYGDTFQYYIIERFDNEENIITSEQLSNREIGKMQGKSRYDQLNGMIIAEQLGEHQTMSSQMEAYDKQMQILKEGLLWIR